jgi:hypothetical protein
MIRKVWSLVRPASGAGAAAGAFPGSATALEGEEGAAPSRSMSSSVVSELILWFGFVVEAAIVKTADKTDETEEAEIP